MIVVQKMKFGEKDFLVMDKFEYDNVEYIMLTEDISEKIAGKDLQNLKEEITMELEFVFKCSDGAYENVTDQELYDRLTFIADERKTSGQNPVYNYYIKEMLDNQEKN